MWTCHTDRGTLNHPFCAPVSPGLWSQTEVSRHVRERQRRWAFADPPVARLPGWWDPGDPACVPLRPLAFSGLPSALPPSLTHPPAPLLCPFPKPRVMRLRIYILAPSLPSLPPADHLVPLPVPALLLPAALAQSEHKSHHHNMRVLSLGLALLSTGLLAAAHEVSDTGPPSSPCVPLGAAAGGLVRALLRRARVDPPPKCNLSS